MQNLHRAFGEIVRRRRQQHQLSQEALADRAGIHRTYISAVERGKVRLGLEAAQRIADGLEAPLSSLLAEVEAVITEPGESVE